MTDHLITLLDLMNRLDDCRCDLQLANPEPGCLDAALLVDKARRLVKKAAGKLASAQWDAGVDSEAPGFALDASEPQVTLYVPSSPGRTHGAPGNGKRHP